MKAVGTTASLQPTLQSNCRSAEFEKNSFPAGEVKRHWPAITATFVNEPFESELRLGGLVRLTFRVNSQLNSGFRGSPDK